MWIRFETLERHDDSRWEAGVFRFVPGVTESDHATTAEQEKIESIHAWFNEHLPRPPRGSIDPRAIFWFKYQPDLSQPKPVSPWKRRPLTKLAARVPRVVIPSDRAIDAPAAAEVIARLDSLIVLLQKVTLVVKVITSKRPGYIVYEDQYQIAAIPYRDTRQSVKKDLHQPKGGTK